MDLGNWTNLQDADLKVYSKKNKDKVIFLMKEKITSQSHYFLFERFDENCTEEDREMLDRLFAEVLIPFGRVLGLALFNIREIKEKTTEVLKDWGFQTVKTQEGLKAFHKQDVEVEILNYITGTKTKLTLGLKTK